MTRRRTTPDVKDAIAELRRERRQRERVFARWVADGRLTQDDGDWRMACLDKAIAELTAQVEAEDAGGRLL